MFRKLTAGRLARRARPEVEGESPAVPAARTAEVEGESPAVPAARTAADPAPVLNPSAPPDYFGPVPNWATSPLPRVDAAGRVVRGTGLRKFVHSLPGLGGSRANDLGAYLPVAVPDTVTYPGSDYYEIGLREYAQRMHADLPATRLRGYQQLNAGTDEGGQNTVAPPARPGYLGPVIVAHRDRPVRVTFVNQLPVGAAGRLFLPVDPTVPGAGTGPLGGGRAYPQNRAVLHLRGGLAPWISAGSPRQWITPAGEATPYPRGAGAASVPDMPEPGAGAVTLYYPNQQSGRLLWFHDDSEGIARLNVYAGQLGLYLLDDPVERQLVADGVVPAEQIPLVIQDKTFVPEDAQLAAQDPTWDVARWGGPGGLWYPHVYLPRQNPARESGDNPVGRWDYGPWCRPPYPAPSHPPVPNPYHDPAARPAEPPLAPGTPTPSLVPEAFLDTPVVNGTAYPYLRVRPRAYRFRILNACGERTLNLQVYRAASNGGMWNPDGSLADGDAGEVPMVEAAPDRGLPPGWPTDGRAGGVPDPGAAGPDWIQIGTEGGLLPAPAVLPNRPINYEYDRRDSSVLDVTGHTLLLGPGERADVIIDFSAVPPGTNLILYNDAPAPMPAFDPRYDYYTGGPDQRPRGGAPSTVPGWGPNTRTLLQFQVAGVAAPPFDLAALRDRLPGAYAASQPPPIVPERAYDAAVGTGTARNTYGAIQDSALTFAPPGGTGPVTLPLRSKAIRQFFEPGYGRRVTALGVELPGTGALAPATIALAYADPATEALLAADPATPVGSPGDGTQLWKVTNHGSDTQVIHFQPGPVQLVNRVGWDGVIRPPEANELGWKQSVRMNPRQDTIVALRPALPAALPFKLGDSVRHHDPARTPGGTDGLTQVSPETGHPMTVTNQLANLGWEYVWQSDLLAHQDAGARRPIVLRVSPAQPTGLTATPLPGNPTLLPAIGLVWTNNATRPAATACVIERATDATFSTGHTVFAVPAAARAYTDSTVRPGATYYYRLRTENTAGYSAWSNTVSAAVELLAPTGLTATVPAHPPLRAALGWSNQSSATGIDIQRATNPTFTSGLTTIGGPVATSHVDGAVRANTTYYYRVRTGYLGATSPWSNIATAIVPGAPTTPTGLTATAAPDTVTVVVAWAEDPDSVISGFTLQRATDPIFSTGVTNLTVSGTARTLTVADLAPGTTYYYRIQAVNAVGGSNFTSPITVTTPG